VTPALARVQAGNRARSAQPGHTAHVRAICPGSADHRDSRDLDPLISASRVAPDSGEHGLSCGDLCSSSGWFPRSRGSAEQGSRTRGARSGVGMFPRVHRRRWHLARLLAPADRVRPVRVAGRAAKREQSAIHSCASSCELMAVDDEPRESRRVRPALPMCRNPGERGLGELGQRGLRHYECRSTHGPTARPRPNRSDRTIATPAASAATPPPITDGARPVQISLARPSSGATIGSPM
jgi:hypothetical protein